jgi:hypothetical protein
LAPGATDTLAAAYRTISSGNVTFFEPLNVGDPDRGIAGRAGRCGGTGHSPQPLASRRGEEQGCHRDSPRPFT